MARSQHLRPVVAALGIAIVVVVQDRRQVASGKLDDAVIRLLARQGLAVQPRELCWIDPPPSNFWGAATSERRALARATIKDDPADLYLVRARLGPDGTLLGEGGTYNVTRTASADEGPPLCVGSQAIFTVSIDGIFTAVHTLDWAGEPPPQWSSAGRLSRLQNALTNLQETGQLEGVGRRSWSLDPSAATLSIKVLGTEIHVEADGHPIVLPMNGLEPQRGGSFVRARSSVKARPGNVVTWAVDRVRAFPWIGDDRMQTIKALVFAGLDWLHRFEQSVGGDDGAAQIAADLGNRSSGAPSADTDPETGFPPAPLEPLFVPPLVGEGRWSAVEHDPFVQASPGNPPAFVTTFIRLDHERPYSRAYIALWDPRQVEMHMMAGTVEPVGSTGEAGPGLIPRAPEILRRVVAAFNGGFQAMHGEFGMMGDGVVYLPPKPFAATAALLRDGSNGFGNWPRGTDIPSEVVGYRQNMTALVFGEKFNPYGRVWWGGTPPGWKDKTHSVRTGLCLTRENFIAYFYGTEVDAETLAQAMIRARCQLGIHLDMNAGHTGLEFYRVADTADFAPLGRPLQSDWEAEGHVSGMDGLSFRARRMIRSMGLMNFPRYIHREARDFFYLTLRSILPGADVSVPPGSAPHDGAWQVRGLAQHGYPYAMATTTITPVVPEATARIRILEIDPRTVRVAGTASAPTDAPTVVGFSGTHHARAGETAVWLTNGTFLIGADPPADATQLFSGDPEDRNGEKAGAAVGIQDDGGMLVYVEPENGEPTVPSVLLGTLGRLGCSTRLLLHESAHPALGGTTLLDGQLAPPPEGTIVRLVRGNAPGAHPIFEDTPIEPYSVWHPLQEQRVRYFRKADAGAPGPGQGAEGTLPSTDDEPGMPSPGDDPRSSSTRDSTSPSR